MKMKIKFNFIDRRRITMKSFVRHVSTERARLRHAAFANPQTRKLAFEILQKQPGIAGIKPGPESFLLYLEPEASLDQICQALEDAIPGISGQEPPAPNPGSAGRRKHPYRKAVLKTYLATGITTVTLAAMGFYHLHKAFGWIFTAFAIEHVWARRKAL